MSTETSKSEEYFLEIVLLKWWAVIGTMFVVSSILLRCLFLS